MKSFGFNLKPTRTYDIDTQNDLCAEIAEKVPSFRQCMFCGSCSGTCSAATHVDFHILQYNILFRRGLQSEIADKLDQCMLCGKCGMVCPRGVNTRAMIMEIRKILSDHAK